MSVVSIEDVQGARAAIAGAIKTTPLDLRATFSALCGRQIYLKLENLQKTGSFKVRGALNKIRRLAAPERERGVITASAGNHAQGVAYAARTVGAPVTVVMPETASFSKIEATSGYGAEVILAGRDYAQAYERARALCAERGATYVHAFDDPEVIAGQGTLGLEIHEQLRDADTVVVRLVTEGRLFRFTTELPDRPGELQRLVSCVAYTYTYTYSEPALILLASAYVYDTSP